MSDITTAAEQDAVAESLLGEPSEATETAQSSGTEEIAPEEQVASEQEVEPLEEEADDWLPGEQEKVFPDETLLRYAQRYQKDEQWLSDPLNRQLLIDKLNSDIYLRQQQQAYEQQPEEEPEEQVAPEPTQPQLSREQYFAQLDQLIQSRTDPEVAKQFHADFLRAFGVPEQEIAKLPAQQAMAFTRTVSKYALNLVNTFMDEMLGSRLQNQLSQAYPGFGEMYERSAYAIAWDRVRNSSPDYQSLPAYGSREFSAALRKAAAQIPGFDEMQFTGRNGQPLPMLENAGRKYAMLADAIVGRLNPQLVKEAAAAQVRNQKRADARRSAGNLGSGKSTSAQPARNSSKFQTNADIFDDDTMEMWKREHGRL